MGRSVAAKMLACLKVFSAALPPDVGRGSASPASELMSLGFAPGTAFGPKTEQSSNQGPSPVFRFSHTAWLSHAAHPAAKPSKSTLEATRLIQFFGVFVVISGTSERKLRAF
jgi:hypothetical protein